MFWSGATRFESLQGETIVGLALSNAALAETLTTLSPDSPAGHGRNVTCQHLHQ